MYESHFGLSGSPFQLNPDPAFYFDSRGHSNALAYLKFGAHQGEGFIVVTGEIGTGKTTLVRTLLEGLDPAQVVAAQVVSTQLESGELLQAILMSFGVASSSNSKAHLIGTLEAFLTSLAAKGRRALLIIDEAQNLKHEAVEELRMLSNFQLGKYGLLQSFLVGQPELRQLLQSKSMEQLRQRVIASCHLGPLQPTETRAYIEHRLHLVSWSGRPEIQSDAFDRVHAWTGGVPRKVNRLCNRLLLGAFLSNEETISAEMVDRTASDLKSEIGELSEIQEIPPAPERLERLAERATAPPPPQVQRLPQMAAHPIAARGSTEAYGNHEARARVSLVPGIAPGLGAAEGTTRSTAGLHQSAAATVSDNNNETPAGMRAHTQSLSEPKAGLTVVLESKTAALAVSEATAPDATLADTAKTATPRLTRRAYREGKMDRPIICLVDSASDFLKAGTLADVFSKFPPLPQLITFHPGPESGLSLGDTGADELPVPSVGLNVENLGTQFALQACQVIEIFDQVISEFNPSTVLAMGSSDAVLACSLVANKRGVGLVRLAGGQRQSEAIPGKQLNGALIDKVSDALYVNRMDSYYTLYQEGIKSDMVLCVGNLVGDTLKHALTHAPSPEEILLDAQAPAGLINSVQGFALIAVGIDQQFRSKDSLSSLLDLLCELGRDLPVIWPLKTEDIQRLQTEGAIPRLRDHRVIALPAKGYLYLLGLVESAKCLVADAEGTLVEEAAALRVPTVRIAHDSRTLKIETAEESASSEGNAANPVDAVRKHLRTASPPQDIPAYWDSGTATRIANHLLLWLPNHVKPTLVRA